MVTAPRSHGPLKKRFRVTCVRARGRASPHKRPLLPLAAGPPSVDLPIAPRDRPGGGAGETPARLPRPALTSARPRPKRWRRPTRRSEARRAFFLGALMRCEASRAGERARPPRADLVFKWVGPCYRPALPAPAVIMAARVGVPVRGRSGANAPTLNRKVESRRLARRFLADSTLHGLFDNA